MCLLLSGLRTKTSRLAVKLVEENSCIRTRLDSGIQIVARDNHVAGMTGEHHYGVELRTNSECWGDAAGAE